MGMTVICFFTTITKRMDTLATGILPHLRTMVSPFPQWSSTSVNVQVNVVHSPSAVVPGDYESGSG